jgi:hypothetical protein
VFIPPSDNLNCHFSIQKQKSNNCLFFKHMRTHIAYKP